MNQDQLLQQLCKTAKLQGIAIGLFIGLVLCFLIALLITLNTI